MFWSFFVGSAHCDRHSRLGTSTSRFRPGRLSLRVEVPAEPRPSNSDVGPVDVSVAGWSSARHRAYWTVSGDCWRTSLVAASQPNRQPHAQIVGELENNPLYGAMALSVFSFHLCARQSLSPHPSPSTQRSTTKFIYHQMGALKEPLPTIEAEGCAQNTCDERLCTCRAPGSDEERTLIDIDVVRNIIIGLSDGLTVPFGLTAGLSSLGSSRLVVVAGMAELISGAISMGVGGYLASEADRDQFRYRQRLIRKRVAHSCSNAMDRQVQEILQPFGISQSLCGMVSNDLLKFEYLRTASCDQENMSSSWKKSALVSIFLKLFSRRTPHYDSISREKSADEETIQLSGFESESLGLGMTQFLLKYGEGVEEVSKYQMYLSAFTIGFSYFIGGLIPMAPYFFVEKANVALFWSIGVMAYFTGARIGFMGYLKGSLSTIVVGGGAAAASYWVVKLLDVKE
ncbi:hypothetical protein PTTG_00049 [Puccinia triticina 1-1 BBBD Race 1]|uniref:Membrane fraction protein n=1 Tax=Puccinia triticina (isolate 1-1 / race 1 (BBBD)) TaxID=630390 RepID=A0A0C4EH33_PUCT1|nr:hypothetical protein PTTG_00049 [Puccinia triticina 1-1 BBBD Race 1]